MVTAHPANRGAAVDINAASAISASARYQPGSVAIRYPGSPVLAAAEPPTTLVPAAV
jgi:hypothetical protein